MNMSEISPNERIEKIAGYTKTRLETTAQGLPEANPLYHWQHILRVTNYGKVLAEAEGANVELVVAACLLHDIAVFDPGDPTGRGRRGAEISRPFLGEIGYLPEEIDNICYSIATHVDVPNPKTLEAKVVTDADNLDRFGAYRAILECVKHISNYNLMIGSLTDRMQLLHHYQDQPIMETSTGNMLFGEQVQVQLNLFEALVKENDWTVLPQLPPI